MRDREGGREREMGEGGEKRGRSGKETGASSMQQKWRLWTAASCLFPHSGLRPLDSLTKSLISLNFY